MLNQFKLNISDIIQIKADGAPWPPYLSLSCATVFQDICIKIPQSNVRFTALNKNLPTCWLFSEAIPQDMPD